VTQINIIDSELKHVRELAKSLRQKDRLEALRAGFEPHKVLYNSYKQGVYRKTAFINNEIAAMWGVAGTLFGNVGQPYLITAANVETIHPVRFAKIYKKEAEYMNTLFPILSNYVDANYKEAVRMLELAGFKLSDEIMINGNSFREFSMGKYS
jgi:hypothetical protein